LVSRSDPVENLPTLAGAFEFDSVSEMGRVFFAALIGDIAARWDVDVETTPARWNSSPPRP